MLGLNEWDEDYLITDILPSTELNSLEKKPSDKFALNAKHKPLDITTKAIAKQVSAFSNASHGYLVFGITDDGKLDAGVPIAIGEQSTKDWIEAIIPKLLEPSVTGCAAKLIKVAGHHARDRGALAVSIPLSESRPHWTKEGLAFIRAGAHSVPMPIQTLLDMASRGTSSVVEIVSVEGRRYGASGADVTISMRSTIRLARGTVCRVWAFDLFVDDGKATFVQSGNMHPLNVRLRSDRHVCYTGEEPLLPGRNTLAMPVDVAIRVAATEIGGVRIKAQLSAEAASPVQRWFRIENFSIVPVDG